ncbi:glycerol-3-phosphate 1-O-acyltransferase PlsY [Sphingomonas sp.]|uniref:glycerol-3-phosphate 1-O-acyltransferase PlsY n=1 Tax=Sphingomonas sp. TaxID=28214 RepID=UPI003AFFFCE7
MSSAGSILLAAALIGYVLGSIPFGLLVTRIAGAPDPRHAGSRNIGATNVLRTGGKALAAATLLFDALKGAAAVLLVQALHPELLAPSLPAMVAGLFAFLGHLYPVWLRFRGGKGVATMLGVAASLSWQCGLAFAGAWLLAVALTRHSSVGGMTAAAATPVAAAVIDEPGLTLLFLGMMIVVLWKHRGNVERLLDGTEPRVGAGS